MHGHLNVKEKGLTYDNYTVIVSLCHRVVMSSCHYVIVSLCHRVVMSSCSYVIVSLCHRVVMSSCRYVIVSLCHRVVMSLCRYVIVFLCQLRRTTFKVVNQCKNCVTKIQITSCLC